MKSRQESNIENEYNNTYSTLLTAPQFSYCFPFIAKTVLLETTKKDDQLAHDILQVCLLSKSYCFNVSRLTYGSCIYRSFLNTQR